MDTSDLYKKITDALLAGQKYIVPENPLAFGLNMLPMGRGPAPARMGSAPIARPELQTSAEIADPALAGIYSALAREPQVNRFPQAMPWRTNNDNMLGFNSPNMMRDRARQLGLKIVEGD